MHSKETRRRERRRRRDKKQTSLRHDVDKKESVRGEERHAKYIQKKERRQARDA